MVKIKGNYKNIYQYITTVNPPPYNKFKQADYAIITIEGETVIELVFDSLIENVVIRPISANIQYSFEGNKVEVIIDRSVNFSVEINNSIENCVMVFADTKKNYDLGPYENVIVFERGTHITDTIEITKDNTAVVFHEGAYVNGHIIGNNANNIGIFGNGVITMENYASNMSNRYHLIYLENCTNIKICDVTLSDSCGWSCKINGCDGIEIDNLKIIGCRGNSDGVDICGSRNAYVHNCFTRVWDDSLVVKAFDTGDVNNIIFENCTLWCDMARPIEVGVELRAECVKNVVFRNIDVIHSMCGYPILGIHHGDRAKVSDIVFEDIRIEDAPSAQLFDIRITDSVWNKDLRKGTISNIVFRNVSYMGNTDCQKLLTNSRIEGFSEEAYVEDVTIENITVCGKSALYDLNSGVDIYNYVKNVKFISAVTEDKAGIIKPDILISDKSVDVRFFNRDKKDHKISAKLVTLPKSKYYPSEIPIELDIKSGEERVFKTNTSIPAGKYVLGVESKSAELVQCYKYINKELVLNSDFSEEYFFTYSDVNEGVRFAIREDLLVIKSNLLKKHSFNLYTGLPTEIKDGEVLFSIRDTDMGMAPAVIMKNDKEIMAPQLRNCQELTYVFKNHPIVENFKCTRIEYSKNGEVYISLDKLGIGKHTKEFILELEMPEYNDLRYSCSLFHSQQPAESMHMFVNIKKGE